MFKKPGGRVGCRGDMGNASERMDGSERYDDGRDPQGPLRMRWPGSNRLFALARHVTGQVIHVKGGAYLG